MPVQTRYVVMRNDIEVKTFMDKKSADEYDKMLDIADNISVMLDNSPLTLSDDDKEKLSIFFAKEKEQLLIALQAKKPKPIKKAMPEKQAAEPSSNNNELKQAS